MTLRGVSLNSASALWQRRLTDDTTHMARTVWGLSAVTLVATGVGQHSSATHNGNAT
jgi:hypothetical protein